MTNPAAQGIAAAIADDRQRHTPGPWKHDETWGLIKYGKTEICALHSGDEANARLIAAAPDLLAVCVELVEYLEDFGTDYKKDGGKRSLLADARAATDKARVSPMDKYHHRRLIEAKHLGD